MATVTICRDFEAQEKSLSLFALFPHLYAMKWWDWMASLTRWMWVWVNSGSWWWTGRPGVLQFMGLQRVRHDWVTELNWTDLSYYILELKPDIEQWTSSKLEKEYFKAIYFHPAYLSYMQSTLFEMLDWMKHKRIKIAARNINNLRYADDTTLMAESKEELKSLLMKMKEWKRVGKWA